MKKIVLPVNKTDKKYNEYGAFVRTFLFQLDYDFCLIMYPAYEEIYHHLDFKEDLVNQVMKLKRKEFNGIKIGRGYTMMDVKRAIIYGNAFKDNVSEISYIYSDMTGKEYAFVNKNTFIDYLELSFSYCNNYLQAKQDIEQDVLLYDNQKKFLVTELDALYYANVSDVAYCSEYKQVELAQLLVEYSIKNRKKLKNAHH